MTIENLILRSAKAIDFESYDTNSYKNFGDKFHKWIHSTKQTVAGLPPQRYLVSGITDAFNQTYGLYYRIGVFDGEYEYHKKLFNGQRVTDRFRDADVIIVSHPFSADGMSAHDKLAYADQFNKPIFVDCAFFGVCRDISFDFRPYKNIRSVCFSLSKSYGTGYRRVGLLYTRDNYPVCLYGTWEYPLTASAEYHYRRLGDIGPDDLAEQYRQHQIDVCTQLKVQPSNTVIFGLDYSDRYPDLKRGPVNRLCLTDIYAKMDKQTGDKSTNL